MGTDAALDEGFALLGDRPKFVEFYEHVMMSRLRPLHRRFPVLYQWEKRLDAALRR
jgi:hypothetical protein